MSKVISETLANISDSIYLKTILNRSNLIDIEFLNECLSFWNYDLYTRKLGIAYNTEGERYTTLDLATLIFSLVQRSAVIYLPEYEKQQPSSIRDNEIVVDETRKGECLAVASNKEVFNFSMRIKDMSINQLRRNNEIEEGAYRTYLLTNMDGSIYSGWKNIMFVPTAKENDFLFNKDVWPDTSMKFEYFSTPEKWISLYGQYFYIAKTLISRLLDERAYLKVLIKDMLANRVRYPASDGLSNFDGWGEVVEKEIGTKIKVDSFQCEVDHPDFNNIYPKIEFTSENLKMCSKRVKLLNKYLEKFRFLTRSIELAFSNKVKNKINVSDFPYPPWIKNFEWEKDFRFPKQRNKWYRLKLKQMNVGEFSLAIRFRWTKSTQYINERSNN